MRANGIRPSGRVKCSGKFTLFSSGREKRGSLPFHPGQFQFPSPEDGQGRVSAAGADIAVLREGKIRAASVAAAQGLHPRDVQGGVLRGIRVLSASVRHGLTGVHAIAENSE